MIIVMAATDSGRGRVAAHMTVGSLVPLELAQCTNFNSLVFSSDSQYSGL